MTTLTDTPTVPDGLHWETGWCWPCGETLDVTPIPAIGRRTVMTVCRKHYGKYSTRFRRTIQLHPWHGLLSRARSRSTVS